jgi:hypothetical protein
MENEKPKDQDSKKTKKKVPKCKCKIDGKRCKKKLSSVDLCIVCKCGKSFCPKHRSPESHNCKISEILAQKNREEQLNKVLGGGNFKQIEVI